MNSNRSSSSQPICKLPIQTSEGDFLAWYSKKGLAKLEFPLASCKANAGRGDDECASVSKAELSGIRAWHSLTKTAVLNSLKGRPVKRLPPIDVSSGTEFQKKVWRALAQLGCGETASYGDVARAIKNPAAVRAVGQACGANPIPVIIPCHRVLAATRKLGGFSGGLDWKVRLLKAEGIAVQR